MPIFRFARRQDLARSWVEVLLTTKSLRRAILWEHLADSPRLGVENRIIWKCLAFLGITGGQPRGARRTMASTAWHLNFRTAIVLAPRALHDRNMARTQRPEIAVSCWFSSSVKSPAFFKTSGRRNASSPGTSCESRTEEALLLLSDFIGNNATRSQAISDWVRRSPCQSVHVWSAGKARDRTAGR